MNMRTVRRFFPSVELMSTRILPSSIGVGDPTTAGSSPSPLIDINDPAGPSVQNANLLIIAPTNINTTSTLC
jgi:hypothetical protein